MGTHTSISGVCASVCVCASQVAAQILTQSFGQDEIRRANNFTDECDAQIFAKLKERERVEAEKGVEGGECGMLSVHLVSWSTQAVDQEQPRVLAVQ